MAERKSVVPAVVLTLVIVAILAGSVMAAFVMGRTLGGTEGIIDAVIPQEEVFLEAGPIVIERIRSLATLTTVEAVAYTTIEKGVDQGWLTWATGDSISLFAVARIGAGVDLNKLTDSSIVANQATGTVTVLLPPAEITYVTVDNEATHVYNRDTGVFTKGDPQLETEARRAAEEILVAQVLEQGLLDQAALEADLVLRGFLEALGYTDIEIVTP
jgi:hypothetical protein